VDDLCDFVLRHPRLFVLSGAGISTDSGIPGYRNGDGQWMRSAPVMLQDFLHSPSARRRYWSRSLRGWRLVADARPNAAHHAVAHLEAAGYLHRLVTQNVDGLHQRAGNAEVIELHGNIGKVVCLDCGATCSRHSIQQRLVVDNPERTHASASVAADGDANVEWPDLDAFVVPACERCAGILKPDVVFFGEGVPRDRVDAARAALARADAMLVVGSSLMVYSGYRICEWAAAMGKPIAAINLGRTRADALFALKIERSCASALLALTDRLCAATAR
jgi:NAD-dependent SIR2 family protein deacetylase